MSRPQLEMEQGYIVDCHDLDKVVAVELENYPVTWRSLESSPWDGFHNGSFEQAEVYEGVVIEDDEDQSFGRWITGEGPFYLPEDENYAYEHPSTHHMLQWLCNRGRIPAGKYVVKMWW